MYHAHLEAAKKILSSYTGDEPFHLTLKTYFRNNKKHGGRDRKSIAALCYNFFRLGYAYKNLEPEKRILLGSLVAEKFISGKPEGNIDDVKVDLKTAQETERFDINISTDIFPFVKELSDGIDAAKFNSSFLFQPDTFLRIRPGAKVSVKEKLAKAEIAYAMPAEDCISVKNATKIEDILAIDKEVQVQDYNSQRTGDMIRFIDKDGTIKSVWDCCAASGGKSIMAVDLLQNIELTVSDKRGNILDNLKSRFAKAGIKDFISFIADLSHQAVTDYDEKFDLVIADLPCTGSGTWSRTPEQLYYFKRDKIGEYSRLQKAISNNIIQSVRKGGYLLYITCSVFKKENEEVVEFLREKFNLKLVKMELLKGYEMKADSLFVALLQK